MIQKVGPSTYFKRWTARTARTPFVIFTDITDPHFFFRGAVVDHYPKVSQDFNTIENAWDILRQRLNETQPRELESRDGFIKRLKEAVSWMNEYRKERLWHLSTNQKERTDKCLKQKPPGGRTKW